MITVSPDNPSSDDIITFTFTGGHPCPVPNPSRTHDTFIFHLEHYDGPCVSAPLPYSLEWTVGRVEAGDYTVIHSHEDGFSESLEFSVALGATPLGIPAVQPIGLVLMAALLLAAARFAFPRKRRARSR